jgi:hypothetical protein
MKKIILIILCLMFLGCEKITVLEVAIIRDSKQSSYKITYSEGLSIESPYIRTVEFYTLLGVHNFIVNVADEDCSGWEDK